jgi:integrase
MGVFKRPESKFWWLWLETAPKGKQRERTDVLVGTSDQQRETRKIAEQVYFKRMGEIAVGSHDLPVSRDAITFKKFSEWYEQHVVAHHRGATREREILKVLRATFSRYVLDEIDRPMVMEWRTMRAEETSAATSNRELDVLKHLLAAAVPKYLSASPIAGLTRLRAVRSETRILTRDEETRLLAKLEPLDRALVICAIDTLMRLSDVVNLRRDQDRGGYLLVVDPKTEPYRVPVSTRLRAELDAIPHTSRYYFAHRRRAENPRDFRGSIQSMLERACKAAGIPYGRPNGITFHALRHTGTTRLVDANVPLRIVQELGGWKSMRQLERYAHPTEEAKRDAVEKIGSLVTPRRRGTKGKSSKKR